MEEMNKKPHVEGGDKEILYSKAIKAGKRIYYLDVKKNLKEDLFLAITESKKVQPRDGTQISFEKHKIFLYKEDFEKFMDGMNDVINYIKQQKADTKKLTSEPEEEENAGDIKLDIEF
ncbi:PUR family DNA/RNA-binding protein [Parabacteroides sp. OttesenSCG-928-G21]|nr:PUR family DNA/RNA-binding protein [Parabacteroides sp. OttesenSCG-928-G21]